MNKQEWAVFATALGLIIGTAALLTHLRANQRLGPPGVKAHPLAEGIRLQVDLPERVLDYESEAVETDQLVLKTLPQDTSFGQRQYKAADGFETMVNVVLMGSDRTSLHKPQYCLGGSGWSIDDAASGETRIRIERPRPYDLPVMKLVVNKQAAVNGQSVTARGVYVYWFVADKECTAQHWQRMWWMARDMLRTGVLQRWAYVTCFSVCAPGNEEATFERMKQFIAASVPEFQLTPEAASTTAALTQ